LAEGPKSFQDALASPFWSRLLIAPNRKSTNVIVFMEGKDTEKSISISSRSCTSSMRKIFEFISPVRLMSSR